MQNAARLLFFVYNPTCALEGEARRARVQKESLGSVSGILHRGRIQMQGGGVNDSVSWAQSTPYTAAGGLVALTTLDNRLTATERGLRQTVIAQARSFVGRCRANGGVQAPIIKSFPVRGDTLSRRVDIEIHTGQAFVS